MVRIIGQSKQRKKGNKIMSADWFGNVLEAGNDLCSICYVRTQVAEVKFERRLSLIMA
jgi:hypothetical protein